jgi:hypothetical protein
VVLVLGGLGPQVVEVDVAALVAGDGHDLHACEHRAGGVGAVRARGDEADVAALVAAAQVVRADDEQPCVLTLSAGVGLEAGGGEAGDLGQPPSRSAISRA